jgi:hypothetical protein
LKSSPFVPPTSRKRVAIFGAGIAGLTVAHELVRRNYEVQIFEANEAAGGFFRSARIDGDQHMPSEYSWHGFGPWYDNVFDLLKQIPFDASSSIYEKGLSRPIEFGIVPDDTAGSSTSAWFAIRKLFRFTRWDEARWAWMLFRVWTANRRSQEHYAEMNASQAFRPILNDLGWRTWRACFGPWVGSDWTNVSLHQVGLFFRKELLTRPTHHHAADDQGPAWSQGAGDGWLILRGPSSEFWFAKWVAHLEQNHVQFSFNESLRALEFDGTRVTGAQLESGAQVDADVYVLATNPFAAADILARTPALEKLDQLRNFRPLVADGPHTQVAFQIAFGEHINWPLERAAVVVGDSEYNLTLFAVEQVWRPTVDLGDGVKSLWTGTACVATRPGRIYGLPLDHCTKEQFIEEIKAQLASCGGLDHMIQEANDGRSWREFAIVRIEVWHEWTFSPNGIQPKQPKWVNTTNTQRWLPAQKTPVANLLIAGAHTRTDADVWSIEAAVESGRRAAQVLEPDVEVKLTAIPAPIRILQRLDDKLYASGGPHVLDALMIGAGVVAVGLGMALFFRRSKR